MRNISLLYKALALLIAPFLLASCATLAGVGEEGPSPQAESTFPYDQYVVGRPNIDFRVEGGCYIWREGNSWHVRIAKKFDTPRSVSIVGPVVAGKIRVNGALLVDVNKSDQNLLNEVRSRRNDITFKTQLRNDSLGNDVMGFDFTVKPSEIEYCVTFDIRADGNRMPGIIHLGNFMHTPEDVPFKVCLHSFD